MNRRTLLKGLWAGSLYRTRRTPAVRPWWEKRFVEVRGVRLAAVDTEPAGGARPTFLFIHGNPTSSYLWRKVGPALEPLGRCLAPDLVGMGDSAKLDLGEDRYRFTEVARYLEDQLTALEVGNSVVLILHDWGGLLGFDWARRHANRVIGIAHTETIMDGLSSKTAPQPVLSFFRRYRSAEGETAVLRDNEFLEQILIKSLGDRLTDADREEYRRPFRREGEGRRMMLTFPRQVPIDGDPPAVATSLTASRAWLDESDVPKLFINAEPGAIVATPRRRAACRGWRNTNEVTVMSRHFVPEEAPEALAAALVRWARHTLGAR